LHQNRSTAFHAKGAGERTRRDKAALLDRELFRQLT
jgi:hypothetical protein